MCRYYRTGEHRYVRLCCRKGTRRGEHIAAPETEDLAGHDKRVNGHYPLRGKRVLPMQLRIAPAVRAARQPARAVPWPSDRLIPPPETENSGDNEGQASRHQVNCRQTGHQPLSALQPELSLSEEIL